MGIHGKVASILNEYRFGLDMSLITRIYYIIIPYQIIPQEQIQDQLKFIFSTIQTEKYELYPIRRISIARNDAHEYIAYVSLPINDSFRKDIEHNLTLFNPQYGKAKIVYTEFVNINQTRFYLIFINQTQLITRCDFSLYYPGISLLQEDNTAIHSLYLDRNTFISHASSLVESLTQLWSNEIELKNQIQYICSNGKRSVRIDYFVKNLSSPHLTPSSDSIFGKFMNDCIAYQARSIYFIEPRVSNKEIYDGLGKVWRQSNSENNFPINISSEFFIDSSYLTNKNQTLTRLIYTINSNFIPSLLINSINLANIYTNIPYKQYTIDLENTKLNSTVLAIINQALRQSWAKGNSYFFQAKDLFIPSINPVLSDNGQMKINYIIGLRSGDIGDYSQPSEKIYSEIFNKTGLETLVHIRYIPRSRNEISLNNDQTSLFPFDYRSGGPFYGLDWWIILIIIIVILAIWLILCFICYICFRKRSTNRYHHKISKRPKRRIDILAREQDHYLRPSLSSLAFDGPYAESFSSSMDDHQRVSIRTTSPGPELQVRRLSEQDWPHFAMHNPYGLSSLLSDSSAHSTNPNRPL